MIGDNPAARLLNILERGKQYNVNENCREVWMEIFDIDDGSESVLSSRLGKTMALPDQIISIIKKDFPNQINTYTHWSNKVSAGFYQQNLNSHWGSFINNIDSHTITYLSLNADLIQTKLPTKLLEKDQLESLRQKISELLSELLKSDLEDSFKTFLAKAFQKMVLAIDEYRINGAEPIMDNIEGIFGHAFFDNKYKEALSETEFGGKVVETLTNIASTMTIVLGLPALPATFSTYLEMFTNSGK